MIGREDHVAGHSALVSAPKPQVTRHNKEKKEGCAIFFSSSPDLSPCMVLHGCGYTDTSICMKSMTFCSRISALGSWRLSGPPVHDVDLAWLQL